MLRYTDMQLLISLYYRAAELIVKPSVSRKSLLSLTRSNRNMMSTLVQTLITGEGQQLAYRLAALMCLSSQAVCLFALNGVIHFECHIQGQLNQSSKRRDIIFYTERQKSY